MKATKQKQPIGKIELRFNDKGDYVTAYFIDCSMQPGDYNKLFKSMSFINDGDPDTERELCESAKIMLSNLFTVVDKVELADREKYELTTTPERVERNESGIITDIVIAFSLDEI